MCGLICRLRHIEKLESREAEAENKFDDHKRALLRKKILFTSPGAYTLSPFKTSFKLRKTPQTLSRSGSELSERQICPEQPSFSVGDKKKPEFTSSFTRPIQYYKFLTPDIQESSRSENGFLRRTEFTGQESDQTEEKIFVEKSGTISEGPLTENAEKARDDSLGTFNMSRTSEFNIEKDVSNESSSLISKINEEKRTVPVLSVETSLKDSEKMPRLKLSEMEQDSTKLSSTRLPPGKTVTKPARFSTEPVFRCLDSEYNRRPRGFDAIKSLLEGDLEKSFSTSTMAAEKYRSLDIEPMQRFDWEIPDWLFLNERRNSAPVVNEPLRRDSESKSPISRKIDSAIDRIHNITTKMSETLNRFKLISTVISESSGKNNKTKTAFLSVWDGEKDLFTEDASTPIKREYDEVPF